MAQGQGGRRPHSLSHMPVEQYQQAASSTRSTANFFTHDFVVVVGCPENGTVEAQYEFDNEEIVYMDFERNKIVYTVPPSVILNPSEIFSDIHMYKDAMKAKVACGVIAAVLKTEEINPPEETDPPESVLYPADEVQFGFENSLTCFVNHFYPPGIKVSWTKNGHPVSEGVSLSRYYPNKDKTFHQFSTLEFTPEEGDIYTCTVEHIALDRPQTRIWEPDFSHPSVGLDVFCGVSVTMGLLGFAGGIVLLVKGHLGRQ
ncbi:H-2 class II histocompatibility antigen, A-U alpha chain-like [Tautogolabrus adspersus]